MARNIRNKAIKKIKKKSNKESIPKPEKYIKHKFIPEKAKTIAKNIQQQKLIDCIESCQIVFCTGIAGTGKTYVSLRKGIESVILRKHEKFIQIRPAVPAGENLGHLPGDLTEKLDPYFGPIQNLINEYGRYINIDKLKEQNRIEILAIAYARGYTFNNCYVLVTEAQNISPEQIKMILTRIGDNCTMVIEGDSSQHDLNNKKSGLVDAVERFKEHQDKDIQIVELKEIVRNPIIAKILDLYDKS